MNSTQMEGYSIFWVLDKIGFFSSTTFPERKFLFELRPSRCSALVDWMDYLTTVRRSSFFEEFHYVDKDTLINPVLCGESIYSFEF